MKEHVMKKLINDLFPDSLQYSFKDFIDFFDNYEQFFDFNLREIIFDNQYGIYVLYNTEVKEQKFNIIFKVQILISNKYQINEFITIISNINKKLELIKKELNI